MLTFLCNAPMLVSTCAIEREYTLLHVFETGCTSTFTTLKHLAEHADRRHSRKDNLKPRGVPFSPTVPASIEPLPGIVSSLLYDLPRVFPHPISRELHAILGPQVSLCAQIEILGSQVDLQIFNEISCAKTVQSRDLSALSPRRGNLSSMAHEPFAFIEQFKSSGKMRSYKGKLPRLRSAEVTRAVQNGAFYGPDDLLKDAVYEEPAEESDGSMSI